MREPAGRRGRAAAGASFCSTRPRNARAPRATRIEEALAAAAAPDCAAAFAVSAEGVAPQTAMGGYLLSKVLPLVIVVMVLLGAFHPAIDITAGERERGTLETTLSAPIPRAALMTGKVVAVATLAALSGFLNLASMSITVLEGAKLAGPERGVSLPWVNAARRRAAGDPGRRVSVRVGDGRARRARAQLQGGADAADAGLLPVHGAVAARGAGRLRAGGRRRSSPASASPCSRATSSRATRRSAVDRRGAREQRGYGAAALALACRLYDSERLLGADDAGLGLRAWLRHLLLGPEAAAGDAMAPETRRRPRARRSRSMRSRGWCCSRSCPCRPGASRPASPCSSGSACSA